MERRIGAVDARQQFDQVLNEVSVKRDKYIVERNGEPIAAVVPIQLYERWKRSRDAFFDHVEEIARSSSMSEDEGMALALEAVQAVRAERPGKRAQPEA